MDETTTQKVIEPGSGLSMLPAGVQVLIEWIILLLSTLASYFKKKEE